MITMMMHSYGSLTDLGGNPKNKKEPPLCPICRTPVTDYFTVINPELMNSDIHGMPALSLLFYNLRLQEISKGEE
jgi:hypothetical protein